MRSEQDIQADLTAELEHYRANAQDLTQRQTDEFKERYEALGQELSAVLSKGAKPCECGNTDRAPMGMVKTPEHMDRGVLVPTVYEVGCVHCLPYLLESENGYDVEFADGTKAKLVRRSYSARAMSVKDAVKNWNEDKWVEDNHFNKICAGIVYTRSTQDENGVWHLTAV